MWFFVVHSICTHAVSTGICARISVLFWQSSCSSFWRNSKNFTWRIRGANWECLWVCWSNTNCICLNSTGLTVLREAHFYKKWCWQSLISWSIEYDIQVHGARLRGSQEDVVIKVLKPGIEDVLVADLNFVYVVARILEFLNPELSRASLVWCGNFCQLC